MEYNILMKQRNPNKKEWDKYYPITKLENLLMPDGYSLESSFKTKNVSFATGSSCRSTKQLTDALATAEAFKFPGTWTGRITWDYSSNGYIPKSETGSDNIPLAGSVITVTNLLKNTTQYTITITTPSTSSGVPSPVGLNTIYTYVNNGPSYQPTWTKYWSNKNHGHNSGLDADKLDGKHASNFADVNHAHTGNQILTPRTDMSKDIQTAGELRWNHYGSNHTIVDNSKGTYYSDNTRSHNPWVPTHPTLVGYNGTQTYGVRVDSARVSDNATNATNATNAVNATKVGGYTAAQLIAAGGSNAISAFDKVNFWPVNYPNVSEFNAQAQDYHSTKPMELWFELRGKFIIDYLSLFRHSDDGYAKLEIDGRTIGIDFSYRGHEANMISNSYWGLMHKTTTYDSASSPHELRSYATTPTRIYNCIDHRWDLQHTINVGNQGEEYLPFTSVYDTNQLKVNSYCKLFLSSHRDGNCTFKNLKLLLRGI